MNLLALSMLLKLFCTDDNSCTGDNDAAVAQAAIENNYDDIGGCIDASYACKRDDKIGEFVREHCCESCGDNSDSDDVPENSLPPTDETVDLYLLGGQSECVGSADAVKLKQDSDTYPELQDEIEGVWFAGPAAPFSEDRFFLKPLKAGEYKFNTFGPEVGFGERIHAVTGKRVVMVKYCEGGSNVRKQWNPDTDQNSWPTDEDDGTAEYLYNKVDFSSKDYLFINMMYTMRKTEETLTAGGVPFQWAGIVWVQGKADAGEGDPIWKYFGENTARVWNGFRKQIGNVNVPIIDTTGSEDNQLVSGKHYAEQIVEGCLAKTVQAATSGVDDRLATCIPDTTNSCLGEPGLFVNYDVFNFYGYDQNWPEEFKPDDASDKSFSWYKNFGKDNHLEYEGIVLKGRMMANAFVKEFLSDYELPSEYEDLDIALKFPSFMCKDDSYPTEDELCVHDYRGSNISGLDCPL